jgi:hypothetical protein
MTFLIQTDFVFYFATVPAASPSTHSNYLYGVQTFLETNNLLTNAETLGPWALLRHGGGGGGGRRGIIQLVKKFRYFNVVRKCISVHKNLPLSLIQSQLNPLHSLVFINTEFHFLHIRVYRVS